MKFIRNRTSRAILSAPLFDSMTRMECRRLHRGIGAGKADATRIRKSLAIVEQ